MPAGGGYFAVYRSLFVGRMKPTPDRPACDGFAFCRILAETRFKADGDLRRGEVRISTRELADAMGWSHGRARRFIASLERHGEIEPVTRHGIRHGNRHGEGRPFVVVKYEELQSEKARPAQQPAQQPAQPTYKKGKKVEKGNGVAGTPKSEGGDAVPIERPVTKKKPAARSLDAQRAFLAAEIAKGTE